MKKNILSLTLATSLTLLGGCNQTVDDGPVKNPSHQNNQNNKPSTNNQDQNKPTTPNNNENNQTEQNTDGVTDSPNEDDQTQEEIKYPSCPESDPNYAGCLKFGGRDWLIQCLEGVVLQKMGCYDYEECVLDGDNLYCSEIIPEDLNKICAQISGSESLCATINGSEWAVVCENGELYTGPYGTRNCTHNKMACDEIGGFYDCIQCKEDTDCFRENATGNCSFGYCSYTCNDGFSPSISGNSCEPDESSPTKPEATVYSEDFSFITDNKQEGYTTPFTHKTNSYTLVATGRTLLDNNGTDYSIDGAGIIIRTAKNPESKITVTNLSKGIGFIKFQALGWDNGQITVTINKNDEILATKSFTISTSAAEEYGQKFNLPAATGFTMTSMGRIVIDNLSWSTAD